MLDEVREQPEGVRILRRVVERKFTSPLLLLGDEGVGRRFSCIQAVKELFCSASRAPGCGCVNCYQIDQAIHPDLIVITPENGEIKVQAIRDLVKAAKSYPSFAPFKVFLIDGADRMNPSSANALLKTLEEPPDTVLIFLLAETASKVLPTIRSRCGLVKYHSLSTGFVESVLLQSEDDTDKVRVITRMAQGSVGLAVQYLGSGRLALRNKTFALLRLAVDRNVPSLFAAIDAIEKELPLSLRFLEQLIHDLIMIRVSPGNVINQDLVEDLGKMRDSGDGRVSLYRLLEDVRDLREKIRSRIVLPFQVKNLFVQTFGT